MPSGCDPVRSATTVIGPAAPFSSIGTRTTRRARDSTTSSASPSARQAASVRERRDRVGPHGGLATGRDAEQQPVVRAPVARVGDVQHARVVERREVRHAQRMLGGAARVGGRPRRRPRARSRRAPCRSRRRPRRRRPPCRTGTRRCRRSAPSTRRARSRRSARPHRPRRCAPSGPQAAPSGWSSPVARVVESVQLHLRPPVRSNARARAPAPCGSWARSRGRSTRSGPRCHTAR